ncbi:hypothetical protein J9345_04535 [Bacillus subtilis subsp. subtilis]|nr:hypothetical protein AWV81_18235 [Bacillus subtilis subsp. natto]API45095.1 hypothetical protein BSR08_14585 [Bacillus subtilis]AYK80640.1 hypothetical protein D9C20_06060 [Bacillus subtilis subsp. subtilis]UQC69018.1 hypothetical protein ZHX2020_07120 [Bacillus sp. ZHX3]API98432.1 hypothetical protein BKP58_16100 [Bacillus subtilis]
MDQTDNKMSLGEKTVEIPKLTPAKWKQLFGTVDKIPGLVLQVLTAEKSDFYAYLMSAIDIGLDELVDLVAALSDVEADYLKDEVGTDEIVEYLVRTIKKNRLDTQLKNLKSLLPSPQK